MPYKRNYTRNRKRRAANPVKKPLRYKVADTAYKAFQMAKYIKRQINVEHKYYDYDAGATVLNTGTVYNLFIPGQGDTVSLREGDSTKYQNLAFRMTISQGSATSASHVRCIIFRGHQERNVAYTPTMMLQTLTVDSPKHWGNRFRSKILYDKTHTVINTGDTGRTAKFIHINLKLFGHCVFTPGDATIEDGGLYMLLIGNETTNYPSANWYSRVTFTDN